MTKRKTFGMPFRDQLSYSCNMSEIKVFLAHNQNVTKTVLFSNT